MIMIYTSHNINNRRSFLFYAQILMTAVFHCIFLLYMVSFNWIEGNLLFVTSNPHIKKGG